MSRSTREARTRDQERRAWEAEARRQCLAIAERAADPEGDEAPTTEWVEQVSGDMDWDR